MPSYLLYICRTNFKNKKMEMIKSIAITVVAVIIALYVKDMIDGGSVGK